MTTPLHIAVRWGHSDAILLLLKNGADANKTNRFGSAPLHMYPSVDIAKQLIEHGAIIDIKDRDDETPLLVNTYKFDMVKLLIDNGTDVNIRSYSGRTPLHAVISNNNNDIAKLLIDNGADMKGALHLAVKKGRRDIVKLLLSKGANINELDNSGHTPLDYIRRIKDSERCDRWYRFLRHYGACSSSELEQMHKDKACRCSIS